MLQPLAPLLMPKAAAVIASVAPARARSLGGLAVSGLLATGARLAPVFTPAQTRPGSLHYALDARAKLPF